MFGANSWGSFYWGQLFPQSVPVVPPIPPAAPPEFEEQLGILVRHRCGTPIFAGESDSVCGVPTFAVNSETKRAASNIGVTPSTRCGTPITKTLTQTRTQRSTRWPTVSNRC